MRTVCATLIVMLRYARTGEPVDLEEFSIAVEEISECEAEDLLRRQRYQVNMARRDEKRRQADTRPMCSEAYDIPGHGWWACGSHASVTYRGKPCCRLHAQMYERQDKRAAGICPRPPGQCACDYCQRKK